MDDSDFEGSRILERLAEIGKVDDFFEAVDSDDFVRAKVIMDLAGLDEDTIAVVLSKLGAVDDRH